MATGRQNKLTGQAAEHLVCAELGRRGFIATPFAGNVPTFDVVAVDAACRAVPIQVKATRGDTWPTDARALDAPRPRRRRPGCSNTAARVYSRRADLIYVCVVLRAPGDAATRPVLRPDEGRRAGCVRRELHGVDGAEALATPPKPGVVRLPLRPSTNVAQLRG